MSVSKKNSKSLAINYANWTKTSPASDDVKTVAMAANALYGSQKRSGVVMADYEMLQSYMDKDPIWKKCYTA